jgi:hypothetical protein
MSSKKVSTNKPPLTKDKSIAKPSFPKKDLLDHLDSFFSKRTKFFFWFGVIFTALFTLLLFEVKVGPGGDDSAYILRSFDFVKQFKYPSYQGPLYPIFLSPFIGLFGINLPLLKFISAISIVVAAIFFYKAFKDRIPTTLLVLTFVIISFNYYILYFGSQTYNEAFFMMLQAIFLYYAFKFFITDNYTPSIKDYLITGGLLFLMCLTKNVAYASLGALIGYFIITARWKSCIYSLGSFLVFMLPWELLKRILWKANEIQFSAQGSMLLYKDFYNPSMGKENFWGLLQRILDNSNLYLSKHFYKFIGLRSDAAIDILPFLTVITVAVFLLALYLVFRKNKVLLFTGIYTASLLFITFISLQKHWDQWRLIIICFPFMLLMFFTALYYFFKSEQFKNLQFLVPAFAIIIFITSFKVTSDYVKVQRQALERNLSGNLLFGLTPDWQNYILMSQWAAKNVPSEYMIACRKPEISFIYGERKFYGIPKVPVTPVDSIIRENNKDSVVYSLFHIKAMAETTQRTDLKYRQYLEGIVSGEFAFSDSIVDGSNFIGIYKLTPAQLSEMRNDPAIKGIIKEEPNAKAWIRNKLESGADISIVQPDHLYDLLKKSKVKYAILASLRLNPNENTGNIITTLHRYLTFIQLKYPYAFQEVQKIGEEEPSSLIEIKLE